MTSYPTSYSPSSVASSGSGGSHSNDKYLAVAAQVVLAGTQCIVARVSITNYRGEALLDCFVQPTQHITDYRTAQTGLQAEHLYGPHALPLNQVKALVAQRIAGKIIIGHSLWNFLSVLELPHPAINTRDVALFLPFRRTLQRHSLVSLPTLMHGLMRREMSRLPQEYEHPLEQARAALDLFRSSQTVWETSVSSGAWPCALPPSAYARFFT